MGKGRLGLAVWLVLDTMFRRRWLTMTLLIGAGVGLALPWDLRCAGDAQHAGMVETEVAP